MNRPPLWLAAAAVASAWSALYTVLRWVLLFAAGPVHEDVMMYYVAAETGLRHGWAAIYDEETFRAVAQFPLAGQVLDMHRPFASSPVLAWLFAPLTALPEPAAYAVWTALSAAALVFAWRIAAPHRGIAKVTLLLAAVGLWPVLLTLYFGQPTLILLAAVAGAWWLVANDRPVAAGAVLALATFLKPQALLLLPLALLVAGRYRVVGAWALSAIALAAICLGALGLSGLLAWWHVLREVQGLPVDIEYTLRHLFGAGPFTYALWIVQGTVALLIASWRRSELEIVFASGLLGTVATAWYFHEADYSVLVLVAFLVLRTAPPMWHRIWIGLGIIPMQLMSLGPGVVQPVLDLATHAPQLVFDAGWLIVLLLGAAEARRLAPSAAYGLARTSNS
jgi:glycosyl transferase family 87